MLGTRGGRRRLRLLAIVPHARTAAVELALPWVHCAPCVSLAVSARCLCLSFVACSVLLGLGAAAVLLLMGWRIVVLAASSTPRHAEVVQQVFRADPLPVFTPQHLQLVRAAGVVAAGRVRCAWG